MKMLLACLLCTIAGMFLGAYFVTFGESEVAAAIVECIKQPDSCGMEEDDLDPSEQLVPA